MTVFSRIRSLHLVLIIALIFAMTGGATLAFGGSDATTPTAVPYMTSNVASGFNSPTAIAIDDNGNIYVGENYTGPTNGSMSALVKKIDAQTGAVTVFAGGALAKAGAGSSTCDNPDTSVPGGGDVVGDGCPATSAWFGGSNGGIRGLAVWNNYLYIEDLGGYLIHRVNLANNIMELVGGGPTSATWPGDGGPAVKGFDITKNFNLWKPPTGFAVDPLNGNVYFGAGGTTAATIRMITSDTTACTNAANGPFTAPCVITVVNYTGQAGSTAPATGCADPAATLVAKNATVNFPQGLSFDADGNLYIAENKCGAVRKLTRNPLTNMVDQGSAFTTLAGNNTTSGTSLSWYDTTAGAAFFGTARGIAPAGGNNLYLSTTSAIYLYDATTGWAHRIFGDIAGGCDANKTTPYIGCPAPWATRADNSGTGAMALDKSGNLYITDYGSGTVVKVALGTDFIGIAPPATRTVATTQYVLLHGGAVTGATTDSPFSAVVTTDGVPVPGCNSNTGIGDNGTDCVMAVTYVPSTVGLETGLLHVQATVPVDLPLQANGNPAAPLAVTLASDKSVCGVGAPCDVVFTATVTPGENPASTGLAVSGDMSACTGGTSTQAFTAGASNTFTYTCTLAADAVADLTFGPVTASDDQARSGTSNTLLISIIEAPVAQPQTVSVTYNTATPITLAATGTGTLTYTVSTQPSHGTLSGDAPALTYTPNADYSGLDSFTFTASNGVESAAATVDINVLPAAPVAADQSVDVNLNTATDITLTATGTGTLAYAVVRPPAHGTLTVTGANANYTPDADYSGPDSFTFTATDSNNQQSAAATVSITVLSIVPLADDQSVIVTYNTAKAITLTGSGMGTLTYTVLTQPTHGTLTGDAPNLTYTPAADYLGTDSFTFKVNNGTDSQPATVSIDVLPAPPVATSQSITVTYGGSKAVTLAATGSGTLTYTVVTQPAHGTLTGTAPDLTYTATSGYSGADSFTFKASDSTNQFSEPATVSITVLPAAPVANGQSVTVKYNEPTPITLVATGTGTLTYSVVTEPVHGTLTGTAPDLTYTPAANYNGADSFTFKATDSNSQDSAPATVSINVLPAVPVATPQSVAVNYNEAKSIILAATGTGTLSYSVLTQPSHGTLTGTAPNLTYTPAADYLGTDSFTFDATDSNSQTSAAATVSITVAFPTPVANAQSVSVTFNTAKPITLTGSGYGTLTYTVVSQPSHGSLTGTAPNLTYTPATDYSGADSFTFKVTDSNGVDSTTGPVSITVNAGDLTIVAAPGATTSATIDAGKLAVFNLKVSGWIGASGPVSFACSGAPSGSICSVSPGSSTLNGTTPIAVAVMVQTSGATSGTAGSIFPLGPNNRFPWEVAFSFTTVLAMLLALKRGKIQWRLAGACAMLLMAFALSSCGGSAQTTISDTKTPSGTYALSVTATAGNVTKSMPLTLTVR